MSVTFLFVSESVVENAEIVRQLLFFCSGSCISMYKYVHVLAHLCNGD